MATTTFFTVMLISDDVTFRLWGKGLSDALAASGLTKRTSGEDSGQIDWATVVKPAAGAIAGYEMWRFSDALQTTQPLLVKIEYGIINVAGTIQWRVTVGFASNGAGALTGFASTPTMLYPQSNPAAATMYAHKASGASNRIQAFLGYQMGVDYSTGFSAERTHAASGEDTAEGIFVVVWSGAAPVLMLVTYATGLVTTEVTPSALLPSVGSGSTGTLTSFYPFFIARGPFLNPSLNLGFMFAGNVTVGVRVTVSLLGAARIFFPCPSTLNTRGGVAGTVLMVRDE